MCQLSRRHLVVACGWQSSTVDLVRSMPWPVDNVCSAIAEAATSPFLRARRCSCSVTEALGLRLSVSGLGLAGQECLWIKPRRVPVLLQSCCYFLPFLCPFHAWGWQGIRSGHQCSYHCYFVCHWNSTNALEFLTWELVRPTNGASNRARNLDCTYVGEDTKDTMGHRGMSGLRTVGRP